MNDNSDTTQPPAPLPIKRLQESLINRIAAGEVIQRPASALKELIENCLDARSTSIRITVKDGGLKLLQIHDNGCGIRKTDLPILAERFTTSKLSTFSDLSRISTYGFRGEALASISHVAHLTVVTKTKTEQCAWKAHYLDGSLCPAKPGQTADPKPFAGNDGTLITIEDMFYNTPTRLAAMRSSSEEYARILDVVTRYAVHNPHVSFTCKKAGSSNTEISTPASSEVPLVIKLLYSASIAKELLHIKTSSKHKKNSAGDADEPSPAEVDSAQQSWHAEAHFTSANYQAKKSTFLLFINHRLVESPRIKKAVESVYTGILPKGCFPFIYLSLQLDPESVDVNVHPTKSSVHFLNEDEITEAIAEAVQSRLTGQSDDGGKPSAATSRAFPVQTLLTGATSRKAISKTRPALEMDGDGISSEDEEMDELEPTQKPSAPSLKKKTPSHLKVRTSLQDRTLDSMFPIAHPSQIIDVDKDPKSSINQQKSHSQATKREITETQCFLSSIAALRKEVLDEKHDQLSEVLAKHIFVGIVDLVRGLALIQFSTRLYLVNYAALGEELFYQLGLRQFGNMSRITLQPAPPLKTLIKIAVDAEDEARTQCTGLGKADLAEVVTGIVQSNQGLLKEYYNISITDAGAVEALPLLLRGYTPNLDKLPNFLMRLGPQVTWTSEKECFRSILRELAYFYTPGPGPGGDEVQDKEQEKSERWQIEHVLFPCFRKYLVPNESWISRDVVEIANLPELYKVFERC